MFQDGSSIKPILPTRVFTETAGYNDNSTRISEVLPNINDANRVYHVSEFLTYCFCFLS